MTLLIRVLVWLCALCVAFPAMADPAPQVMVRAHLEPSGPVVAGSQVKLVVDCLTTTWFTEAPDWPLFTVTDALVTLPDEQAENLDEEIKGVKWFGVSRAYRITPQAGKVFDIPSFVITVHPGGMSVPVQLTTPALKLAVTVPPGAQDMRVFFPTQNLTATQKIEPASGHLDVGGAVKRTIVQRAAATESMLIPPVEFGDVSGLRRYPGQSSTKNIVQDRAGLVAGERTDSVTYLVNQGGTFDLPPVTITWWNTTTQKKETIVLPAVRLSAVAPKEKPFFAIPVDALTKGAAHRIVYIDRTHVIAACAIVLLVFALVWNYPRVVSSCTRARRLALDARRRYAESEAPAWRALRSAARDGSPQRVIPALYRWMDRSSDFSHPARLRDIHPEDDRGVNALADAVHTHYADRNDRAFRWYEAVSTLRRVVRRASTDRKKPPPLPPLNGY